MKRMVSTRGNILLGAAALLILGIAWLAYQPGLHGPFLFDDYGSMPALGATGPVDNWATFFRFVTSGHADPTGRPLTLLSFLLDARNWPAAPFPFKRTNVFIHLLNGCLLAWLLWSLGRTLDPSEGRAARSALLGASLWLLHPLFVSTTLYIVQREAMLPVTFTLLGLIAWLHGRAQLNTGKPVAGTAWIVAGLGGATALAVLSKANGALLPLLAVVIEQTLLRYTAPMEPPHAKTRYRNWMLLLAWLPSTLLMAYLVKVGVSAATHGLNMRPWTEAERLLTEPRVLLNYLGLLWFPRPLSTGLFNDAYPVSHSLWQPWTTLPALVITLALVVASYRFRRQAPLVATAILFFFAGHLLESTTIPLELYFEHRNYLPALLMFWPLSWWLADWRALRPMKITLATGSILGLAILTYTRASIWGNPTEQALIWARVNPESPRAQAYASQFEVQHGHPDLAIRRLEPLLARDPSQVQLAFNLLSARCAGGNVRPADIQAAVRAMRITSNPSSLLTSWFERAITQAKAHTCSGLDLPALRSLLMAGLDNPTLQLIPGRMQDLHYLIGLVDLAEKQPQNAQQAFSSALEYDIRPGFAAAAAAALGAAGYPTQGLALLDDYAHQQRRAAMPTLGMSRLHAWVLEKQGYWPRELAHLRATLQADASTVIKAPRTP